MNRDPESIREREEHQRRVARAPDRAAALLAEAERLIEARARKLGVPARSIVNEIFDNDSAPDPAEREKDSIAAELGRRLAINDRGLQS